MSRWPGRLITKTPIAPSGSSAFDSAPGVWTIPEVAYWTKRGLWPNAANVGDPYFKYVSFLLGTTSTNAAQNNTFIDSSSNNFTITRNGNVTQGAFSPYAARWSNYFDGSGDYLSIPNNAAFQFGSGDFTIECWVNKPAAANGAIVDVRSGGTGAVPWAVYIDGSNFPYFYDGAVYTSSVAITNNAWNHIAVVRTSGVLKIFVNGVQGYSAAHTVSLNATGSLLIGGTAAYSTGYISDLRIVKNTAVYTSAFAPPSAPLTAITNTSLLTCQSNRFRDASANNFAITANGNAAVSAFNPFGQPAPGYSTTTYGGSAYFDGNGDYLNSAGGSASAMGSGDFSFEAFVYWTGYPTQYTSIFSTRSTNNANAAAFTVGVESSGYVYAFSSAFIAQTSSGVFALNTWNHVVFTRSATTARLFVNGVLRATGTNSQNFSDQGFAVGANRDGTEPGAGYISNVRLVKGAVPTDYQTSSTTIGTIIFTPPTSPVTAISGTSILCNFTNAGIYDASMNNDMETVGNVQVSTAQAKFGSTSIYFDGSGDVLSVPANPVFNFGTGDFTIECWLYPTASATVYLVGQAASNDYAPVLLYLTSGRPGIAVSPSNGTWSINAYVANPLTLNAWSHVAAVRSGNKWSIYVNGVENVLAASSAVTPYISTDPLGIGGEATGVPNYPYFGYIDELRITKGYARYTTNFTPPSSAFFAF